MIAQAWQNEIDGEIWLKNPGVSIIKVAKYNWQMETKIEEDISFFEFKVMKETFSDYNFQIFLWQYNATLRFVVILNRRKTAPFVRGWEWIEYEGAASRGVRISIEIQIRRKVIASSLRLEIWIKAKGFFSRQRKVNWLFPWYSEFWPSRRLSGVWKAKEV